MSPSMQDRLEAVRRRGAASGQACFAAAWRRIEANPPADRRRRATSRAEAVQKLADTLTRYEQELAKMRKDAEAPRSPAEGDPRARRQDEAGVRPAQAGLRQGVQARLRTRCRSMRADIEKEAAKVDPALLERYRAIKQHCTPPMARLVDGQCSGCFMSLPSATLLRAEGGRTASWNATTAAEFFTIRRGNALMTNCEDARRPQAALTALRKVRAPQGRMPVNCRRRRLQGKCNRDIPRLPSGRRKGGKAR